MSFFTKSLLVVLLVALPAFSALAEDDSCELKENDHNNASADSENEFTSDKTWRFKAEDSLKSENNDKNGPEITKSSSRS
ncbi:hypothetical protein [Kaarinaea lacus]